MKLTSDGRLYLGTSLYAVRQFVEDKVEEKVIKTASLLKF